MDWRNELYHHETPPPGQAWERIAEELKGDPVELRQSLRAMEVNPPPASWEKVRETLGGTTPVVPIRPATRAPYWQYVAAAAIAVGTLFGIYYLSSDSDASIGPDMVATSLIPKDSPLRGNPAPSASAPATATVAATSIPTEPDPGHPHTFKEYRAPGDAVSYNDGNYIKVRSTDGKDHRVSYKCAMLLPCLVNGVKPEDRKACAEDLDKWKKKLDTAGFIPAGDNFFDIAGLASMLESSK